MLSYFAFSYYILSFLHILNIFLNFSEIRNNYCFSKKKKKKKKKQIKSKELMKTAFKKIIALNLQS